MAEAGLTRGSFYCYFTSKSDLYAQSVARIVHKDPASTNGAGSEAIKADKIVRDYLSDQDPAATDETFPMIGLPNDVSRTDRAVRQAFEAALKVMVDSFEKKQRPATPKRVAPMRSPLPPFASGAWSYPDRSTTRN
jgi:TetR/AcrR family transcriptional regulator, transcriptional repressor for nem operon